MLEARVLAAPVLVPSGLATECTLALGHAVPLVTTPLGARGLLTARSPGAIAIARTSDEFAAALVSLLLDRGAWDAQRARSIHHAAAHLGAGVWREGNATASICHISSTRRNANMQLHTGTVGMRALALRKFFTAPY